MSSSVFSLPQGFAPAVLVVGLCRSGVAAAKLLQAHGVSVFVTEFSAATPANAPYRKSLDELGIAYEVGGHSEKAFAFASQPGAWAVLSPGIAPHSAVYSRLKAAGVPCLSEVELAWRLSPPELRWLGITGTNGKTTVTTLLAWLLNTGYAENPDSETLEAVACGNIGLPVSQAVLEFLNHQAPAKKQTLVVELSSYQLYSSPTLSVQTAILTNLQPDHLAWHGSLQAYEAAKTQLFLPLQPTPPPVWAVLNAEDALGQKIMASRDLNTTVAFTCKPEALETLQKQPNALWLNPNGWIEGCFSHHDFKTLATQAVLPLVNFSTLPLKGKHNAQNVMASLAAALLEGISINACQNGLKSFTPVEHRLEWVVRLEGVDFYNDSKATNPEACIVALEAFAGNRVVLMAGGEDKGTDLTAWANACKAFAASVVLFGQAKARLAEALNQAGHPQVLQEETLEGAFNQSLTLANKNGAQVVLFSPACASFDRFENFEHRGKAFKTLLNAYASQKKALPEAVLEEANPV